jgi:hypothetical protein
MIQIDSLRKQFKGPVVVDNLSLVEFSTTA